MSYQGQKIAADLLTQIQLVSQELITLGSYDCKTESGKQDIFLGQMFNNDQYVRALKDRFTELVGMNIREE